MLNKLIALLLLITFSTPAAPPNQAVSANTIIDQSLQVTSTSASQDLVNELSQIAERFANDTSTNGLIGTSFVRARPSVSFFLGQQIATMSMLVPLVPGSVGNTSTTRGKLAAKLRSLTSTYLLSANYWTWEDNGTNAPNPTLLSPGHPLIAQELLTPWDHKKAGPYWEKFYALWAYAHYTGDWQLISDNWSFIKARYQDGNQSLSGQWAVLAADKSKIYRRDTNSLAIGLIGYTRLATYMSDSSASTARSQATSALNQVISNLNVAWDGQPALRNDSSVTIKGEWSPGYNLTPELGRWINSQAKATAQTRLDEAVNASELRGRWWTGPALVYWHGDAFQDEDYSGNANLSSSLFLGRAWMLEESASSLRSVKPWPSALGGPQYRDALYTRSVYALTSRQAISAWVDAVP
ncbi:MAG: hypothetical protein Fur005_01570 [Roseiflexaceae bacterium]